MAGAVDCNTGYVAVAIELIATVTGLEGEANHNLLYYFVQQTNRLDMATINKAQTLFQKGLVIKTIKYHQGNL